jgi:hypothetical protein
MTCGEEQRLGLAGKAEGEAATRRLCLEGRDEVGSDAA